ncbi:MAG: hypothetical protein ISS94_02055 [Candidatus Syntrophoarchaeum sp.]|nr:hypothetical protein [Methanomicrobia archaeon]MBL7117553.1 hypothetical protein [Candidatus Syntrophoarchaeum sp.]
MKKSIIAILFIVVIGTLLIISFSNNIQPKNKCESFMAENSIDFPCKYFISQGEIPNGYQIKTDESNKFVIGKNTDPDVSFGPGDGIKDWSYVVYIKEDGQISLNVLEFNAGYDKGKNIEKINSIKEQMTNSLGYGLEYWVDGDRIIILLPLAGSKEEDIDAFKSKLDDKI